MSVGEIPPACGPVRGCDGLLPGPQGSLQLIFALGGHARLSQAGETLQLRPLDWAPCGSGPCELTLSAGAEALVMILPDARPAPGRGGVRNAANGVGSVLLTCIRAALQASPGLAPQARAELGQSLQDLGRLAIQENAPPGERRSRRSIMRERVKAFVRNRLHDSTLSIDDIARAFNCTKRYLHKVFADDERSLNQYIWDLRLERCGQDLANPELAGRSITEIAFAWGFRSTPHFSRAFRQRFSTSPSLYRALVNGEARAVAPAAAPVKAAVGNGADAVVGPVAPLAAASRAPSPRLGAAQALSDFPI